MSPLLFLVPLLPPGLSAPPPFRGQRVRWPGAAGDLVWDGERWVPQGPREPPFDGGDTWLRSEW